MVRSIFALILVLAANTAFAEDKKPPAEPASVSLPAAATQADAGKETPTPQPTAPTCTLPPLVLPPQFTALIRDELVVASRNSAALTTYAGVYKTWAEKRAEFDMCKLQGGTCKDPGNMPQQPKLAMSFLDYLKKSGAPAQETFHAKVGAWLVCTEIVRATALNTCETGHPEILANLEQELKKWCRPLSIDRRRR